MGGLEGCHRQILRPLKTGRPIPPPNLICEREYWRCPVQVFTGLFWLLIGLFVGVLIGMCV